MCRVSCLLKNGRTDCQTIAVELGKRGAEIGSDRILALHPFAGFDEPRAFVRGKNEGTLSRKSGSFLWPRLSLREQAMWVIQRGPCYGQTTYLLVSAVMPDRQTYPYCMAWNVIKYG